MVTLLISLVVLIVGYVVYGAFVEKVFGADNNRKTPAYTMQDGIDYVPMPAWKVFLIQFLNIAGLGPIFGAIMGVMFGPAAFLWIVFGCIFGGAVHDYLSGMISLRLGGVSLQEVIGSQLGENMRKIVGLFSLLLMILVGAVFVINPADLLAGMTSEWLSRYAWIGIIFAYYLLATLLPIDKLIGNLYPLFGAALMFMAIGLLGYMIVNGVEIPDGMTEGLYNRDMKGNAMPIFPMMFVSIACGAISGFHATQSPLMGRCLKNEKLGRPIFYGAMVAEGIVALIWAAVAIAFTGGYDGLQDYMQKNNSMPAVLVNQVSIEWLGSVGGVLALLGVIAAPITSGDTALRSARLIVADFLKFDQKKLWKRLVVTIPIFACSFGIMLIDFSVLWRYFGWCNQMLSVFTLWAITVYLAKQNKKGAYWMTLIPAIFMTMVCVSYLLFAPSLGIALPYNVSVGLGGVVVCVLLYIFFSWKKRFS